MPLGMNLPGPVTRPYLFPIHHSDVRFSVAFTDTTASTDAVAWDYHLNKGDTTTSTDAVAFDFHKNVGDTTTSTDALANRTGKNLADTTTSTDSLANRVGKNFGDSTTSTDAFSRVVSYHITLGDTTTSTDVATINLRVVGPIITAAFSSSPAGATASSPSEGSYRDSVAEADFSVVPTVGTYSGFGAGLFGAGLYGGAAFITGDFNAPAPKG
jgi:hypothetical protein